MKEYIRPLISGIALVMAPLNALGDEAPWENAPPSRVIDDIDVALSNVDAERQSIIADVMAWTVAHTDYEAPETEPEIHFEPRAFFIDQACSGHEPCSAKGVYSDGQDQITLHEDYRDLTGIDARAMLVHELVHMLQDRSGQWTDNGCRSWVAREREAYLLQRRYLIAKGGFPPYALRLPSISEADCEPHSEDHHLTPDQRAASTRATRHRELR